MLDKRLKYGIVTLTFLVAIAIEPEAQNEAFRGGYGDGYSTVEVLNDNEIISLGSQGDGYALDQQASLEVVVSKGSSGDGYGHLPFLNQSVLVSKGNGGDGYSYDNFIKIYWTGNSSTAWLNANNWSSFSVPTNADEIIIPPNRPNYPLLGAQLLSIGDPVITSGFRCKEIWIQSGASFSGKLGTTLANQSVLLIDGTFIWKNPSVNSFLNFNGGEVRVRSGGVWRTEVD